MKTSIFTLALFFLVFLFIYGGSRASQLDSCKLLLDAKPSEALGGPVDKPSKVNTINY